MGCVYGNCNSRNDNDRTCLLRLLTTAAYRSETAHSDSCQVVIRHDIHAEMTEGIELDIAWGTGHHGMGTMTDA